MDELSHFPEVILHQASGGKSRRAEPQAARSQSTFISYKDVREKLRMGLCRDTNQAKMGSIYLKKKKKILLYIFKFH